MPGPAKKQRGRKLANHDSSRQTSLLDVFSLRSSLQQSTPTTSAAPSENGSTVGEDVIDIPSSDAEPLPEDMPMDSSSPITVDNNGDTGTTFVEHETSTAAQPGGSRDVPIIVADSSPIASPVRHSEPLHVPPPPPKSLYSIFAPRKRPEERMSPHGVSRRSSRKLSAPFPDALTQHVPAPQTVHNVPLLKFSRRHVRRRSLLNTTNSHVDSVLSRLVQASDDDPGICATSTFDAVRTSGPLDREKFVNSIPLNHRSYPAISRFLNALSPTAHGHYEESDDGTMLWNDKWRPRRADEVLGNERSALYLRDWLLALKLHIHATDEAPAPSALPDKSKQQKSAKSKKSQGPRGTKRPRIVRDVERKRPRVDSEEPEDAWIADDSGGEDPLDVIGIPEHGFSLPKLSRLKRMDTEEALPLEEDPPQPLPRHSSVPSTSDDIPWFTYTPPKFGDTICNTILLAGPPGCGKTASIYACAEELGWDVFEVYPGIGERSGAALQKLIGEVGKNHMVKQTQHQCKAEKDKGSVRAKLNFFSKRVLSDVEEDVAPETAADVVVPQEPARLETAVVSQSIVLLEEVDVLFREDANFWPSMIKIIKECRRPVVMTCNDMSTVPLRDLPLQCILDFEPCPVSLAASYLQVLSLSENQLVDNKTAGTLYHDRSRDTPESKLDKLLHSQHATQSLPDLRRTLNQLQLGASTSIQKKLNEAHDDDQSIERLKRMARSIELRSFMDSGLRRPQPEVLRDLMVNSTSPYRDDLVGSKHLTTDLSDYSTHLPVMFSTYHRDEMILDDLASFERHDPVPDGFPSDSSDSPALHTSHCASLLPVLDYLHIPRYQLLRDPDAIFLDYEPWIRFMVRVDDAHISAHLASALTAGTTRRTRNSQRTQRDLVRCIDLEEDERDIVRRTAFDLDVDVGSDPSRSL